MTRFSIRQWFQQMASSSRPRRPASHPNRRQSLLRIEDLEGRCVPTTVTTLDDAGPGSLRQAILDTPAGGTVDFQPGLSGTITLTSGELAVNKDLTVAGPGPDVITVSGNHASRVFDIAAQVTVALSGLTIADGFSLDSFGGGIQNNGTLTVTGSTFTGNRANFGGGIQNSGTLTVTGSTLSGNSAADGGGIDNEFSGTLTVTDSTLSGNSAGFGGGIENLSRGMLTVTDSTLSGNSAGNSGGGIESDTGSTLTVTDSTLSGNSAAFGPGGIDSGARFTVLGLVTIDGDYRQSLAGTLTLGAGNTLILAGLGTIDGSLSTAGTLVLGDATGPGQLTISGGLTNNGEINIAAGSTLTVNGGLLTNQAGATLTLGGTLTVTQDLINDGEIDPVGDSPSGGTQTLTVGGTLTNAPDGTITPQASDAFFLNAQVDNQGTFTIAEDTMLSGSLTNSGTLTLASVVGHSLSVTGGDVANSGTVVIGPGDNLSVDGNYTQTSGSTQLDSGQLSATGLADLEGGVLGGSGTVQANVLNNSEVDVGQPGSPGALTIVGDYTQTAGGVLVVEIGGPNAGTDFDQLNVTGQAPLDGTLTVNLINGFVPSSGDSFPVLTFGSETGAFATVNGDGPLFTLSYDPTDVTLVAN
jgi:hypothetical protein